MDDDGAATGRGREAERAQARRSEAGRRAERLGWRGERAAARALRSAGYVVLGRRVRTPAGEVDVVALDGETLVVVEVKAASVPGAAGPSAEGSASRAEPDPARRVDHRKRARLAAAARWLARGRGWASRPVRFDVVVVRLVGWRARCTIHREAFSGSGR